MNSARGAGCFNKGREMPLRSARVHLEHLQFVKSDTSEFLNPKDAARLKTMFALEGGSIQTSYNSDREFKNIGAKSYEVTYPKRRFIRFQDITRAPITAQTCCEMSAQEASD